MSLANITNAALSDYSSLSPEIIAQFWSDAMQQSVIQKEWFSKFQGGEDSMMPIIEKQDLSRGDGDTINFTVGTGLAGDGVQGASTLIGNEEKAKLRTYQVEIDWVRHATAADRRFRSMSIAGRKLAFTKMLSEWMALKKQNDGILKLIKQGAFTTSGRANNTLWAGDAKADNDLTINDQLHTGFFTDSRRKLIGLGAKPANISREEGYEVPKFILVATTDMLTNLNNDGAWINAQSLARPREGGADEKNPLFTGCFSGKEFGGIVPFEFMQYDHDNAENGAIGSPLQPRALTRAAMTSSDSDLVVGGSSASGTSIKWLKWFPGYDFLFTAGQSASADSNTYYAKIIDMPGTANAGKFEIISYTGSVNNGNKLTAVTRNVTGSTNTTQIHAADSLVVPCNAAGVAYGFCLVMGAWALLRAYGSNGKGGSGRETLETDKQDYNFIQGAAIEANFGQAPAQRADGKFPNFVVGKVALRD